MACISSHWLTKLRKWSRMLQPLLHLFFRETAAQSVRASYSVADKGNSITHPEASSAQPPPSSAPVWVAEQTPPSRRQWPGSADPKLRRSPQTRLHLSSSPEKKGVFTVNTKNGCGETIPLLFFVCLDFVLWLPSVILTTFHLSLTTSATDRMSVCSPAPLILSALSYCLHLASVTHAPHWKHGTDFKIQTGFLFESHITLQANGRANNGKSQPLLLADHTSYWTWQQYVEITI